MIRRSRTLRLVSKSSRVSERWTSRHAVLEQDSWHCSRIRLRSSRAAACCFFDTVELKTHTLLGVGAVESRCIELKLH